MMIGHMIGTSMQFKYVFGAMTASIVNNFNMEIQKYVQYSSWKEQTECSNFLNDGVIRLLKGQCHEKSCCTVALGRWFGP